MTTVRDGSAPGPSPDELDVDAFIAARQTQRAREAEQLAARRREHQEALRRIARDHAERVEALLRTTGLTGIERERLLGFSKLEAARERSGAQAAYAAAVGDDRPLSPFAQWFRDRADARTTRHDYLEYVKALYREGARSIPFDRVIVALAGSRRARRDGMTVYTMQDGWGERELLRVVPETREVIVRDTHERSLEASIVRAHHEFGPPIHFASADPTFLDRCAAIATRYGFESTSELLASPAYAAAGTRGAPWAAGPRGPTSTTQRAAPIARAPEIAPSDYREFIAALEEGGIDDTRPLTADSQFTVVGEFLGAAPHVDHPGYAVVAVRTANGAALIALQTKQLEPLNVGAAIRVSAVDGEWRAETVTPQRSDDGPPQNREERGRGR